MPSKQDRPDLPTGTVTFLFTDIEGSTKLVTTLGAAYTPVLEAHTKLIRSAVAGHDGTEVATEGDAVFAAFPSALEALRAAAEAQLALAAYPWPDGVVVRVRMGLHTGEGRLGGDDYVGIDVHRAARIAAAGHGGQVLLSDATAGLVRSDLPAGVAMHPLGEHSLKDSPVARIAVASGHRRPSQYLPRAPLAARSECAAAGPCDAARWSRGRDRRYRRSDLSIDGC